MEAIKKAGLAKWEKKLRAIKIESPTDNQKKIFYTAMYHTMVQSRDRTGDNPVEIILHTEDDCMWR